MNRNIFLSVLPFLLFSIIFSSLVLAAPATTTFDIVPDHMAGICLNDTTTQHVWIMFDNTDWQTFYQNETCLYNCSTTLGDCRANEFDQMQLVMAIIVSTFLIGGVGIWFGLQTEGIDFPIYAFQMFYLAYIGFGMDVFLPRYQTIIGAMTLVPVGFLLLSLWLSYKRKKQDRQGDDVIGRTL